MGDGPAGPLAAGMLISTLAARSVPSGILSGTGHVIAAASLEWLGHAGVVGGSGPLLLPMLVIGIGAVFPGD